MRSATNGLTYRFLTVLAQGSIRAQRRRNFCRETVYRLFDVCFGDHTGNRFDLGLLWRGERRLRRRHGDVANFLRSCDFLRYVARGFKFAVRVALRVESKQQVIYFRKSDADGIDHVEKVLRVHCQSVGGREHHPKKKRSFNASSKTEII